MSFKTIYAEARAAHRPMKRHRIKKRYNNKPSVDGDTGRRVREDSDQIVREIIALRDKRCVTCPETEGLQVGHLFRRGNFRTRWDLRNCAGQCETCNKRHNDESEHYIEAFLMKHGEQAYNELRQESRRSGPLNYSQLCDIRDDLRAELGRLKINTCNMPRTDYTTEPGGTNGDHTNATSEQQ